ncbi:MAG: hypothetical protein AAF901_14055, partial [Bacteroidota bacterium]
LELGDIIIFGQVGQTSSWYGTVVKKSGQNYYTVRIIDLDTPSPGTFTGNTTVWYKTTKNPPYRKAFQDWWGYFKSDYKDLEYEPISTLTTEISSKSVDAWSLRKIISPTGAEISVQYGSDQYNEAVFEGMSLLNVSENGFVPSPATGADHYTISFVEPYDLTKILNVSNDIALTVLSSSHIISSTTPPNIPPVAPDACSYKTNNVSGSRWQTQMKVWDFLDLKIISTTPNSITVWDTQGQIPPYLFSSSTKIINGFVPFKEGKKYGGGLKVEAVSLSHNSEVFETQYDYELGNGVSTGVTMYEPTTMDQLLANPSFFHPDITKPEIDYWDDCKDFYAEKLSEYKSNAFKYFSGILAFSQEIPGPGVMYSQVKERSIINNSEVTGHQVFEFEVPHKNTVEIIGSDPNVTGTIGTLNLRDIQKNPNNDEPIAIEIPQPYSNIEYYRGQISIKNYTSTIGNLKRTATYDSQDRLVAETKNIYLHDAVADFDGALANTYRNQGLVEQVFFESRTLCGGSGYYFDNSPQNSWHDLYFKEVSTKRSEYPNILLNTISTENGVTTRTTNKAFDFFTGAVTETETEDS